MATQEKLLAQFQENYNSLNTEQKLAVDTIEGPVLVNAGPGTGKTQILSTRIGNILLNTDTDPHQILCLTYTDNGAVEMRKRLLKIIGTAAYNVRIHTFHSFCNEVIQENLTYFGKLNLEPISELEEIELFYQLIDNIPTDNPLKRHTGKVYYEKQRLKNLFSIMKKEAWSPEYMKDCIEKYIVELPTKEGFFYKKKYKDKNAGDPKEAAIQTAKEEMEKLKAAVDLFPVFNEMMSERGRYNFEDMILWVLKAFDTNSNMLLNYQERFLYVLVDEFQDTSRSQNLLLQQLTSYWDTPNLFVVGDADQSIYSFQDANVQNIISFREKYLNTITQINLINNYRSTQKILDAAHGLIINNTQRIALNDVALTASNTNVVNKATTINIFEYPNISQEAIDVAITIENLITKNNVAGKDIAVIYRNHAQVDELATILEQKQIAVNTKKEVNILQLPIIKNIIDILIWIDKEKEIPYSADETLFKILHSNFFQISSLEIAKQVTIVNEKNKIRGEEKTSLRKWLNEQANADLFKQTENTIYATAQILENLIKESSNCTLQQLFEKLIQSTGILKFIMQSPEMPWLMQVIATFFNYIKDETKRNPELTLTSLLKNISLLNNNLLSIPLTKISATNNGVNFITAHSSKGSEYDYVFIIGCTDNVWDKINNTKNNFKLPDNLVGNNSIATDLEESRRLFYVAVTRAKTNLYITYSLKGNTTKANIASKFVEEIAAAENITKENRNIEDANILATYTLVQLQAKAQPEIELIEDAYLNKILETYTLSVTHLNNYLSCPIKFYFQNFIKVPGAKNEHIVFGSAVHYALEILFKEMKDNNDTFPSEEKFVNNFLWYMYNNREAFTKESYILRTAYGKKILPAYYQTHIQQWNKIVAIEKAARNIIVHNIPLNGKFDKLEFNGTQVRVVDYKTGKHENAIKKLVAPGEKEPNGGDYWRQAVFYKILIDNDKTNNWHAVSTVFEFIEPVDDAYKVEEVMITPEDITTVTQQIIDTWQKIQAKDFKKGCGKKDCEWCNFVKTNNLAVALHLVEDEEE